MPRACNICNNSQRLQIDREIVQGKSKSKIALDYGVPVHSLDYHARHHLSRQILESYERKGRLVSDELVGQFEGLFVMAKQMHEKSLARDSVPGDANAIRALAEMRAVLDTMCRVLALLVEAKALEQEGQAQGMEPQMDLSLLTDEELDILEALQAKACRGGNDLLSLPQAPDGIAPPVWKEDLAPELAPTPIPARVPPPLPRPKTPVTTVCKPGYAIEDPDPAPDPAPEEPQPEKPRGLPPAPEREIPGGGRGMRLKRHLLGRKVCDRPVEFARTNWEGPLYPGGEE